MLTIPRSGLVAEYLFVGDASDTSGAGHHGEVSGADLTADRFGTPSSAYHFDGIDDCITVFPPPRLGGGALSVSIWGRFAVPPRAGWSNCLIAQDNGDDDDQSRRIFQLSCDSSRVVWHEMMQVRDPICRRRIEADTWYHYVAVCGEGIQQLYLDGVLQDTLKHPIQSHLEEPIHIGRKGSVEPNFYFHGDLDDVRIYNRVLLPDEIAALYGERGFAKPAPAVDRSPVFGKWGRHGVMFLDLHDGGAGRITGTVMAGRPGNLAPIGRGHFAPEAERLVLDGEALHPRLRTRVPYRIEAVRDGDELTASAQFGREWRTVVLTRRGAHQTWWQRSPIRRRLLRWLSAPDEC